MGKIGWQTTRRGVLGGIAIGVAAPRFFSRSFAADTAPRRGGVLTQVHTNIEPPFMLSIVNTSSIFFSARATEGLLQYDFKLKPQPLLATSWAVSADGLQYSFKLRQGVKWHDGQDFTSADVAFSIKTLKKYHPRGRITFSQVNAIETPDAYTVVLHLTKPTPFLLTALSSAESPIVPEHVYGDSDPMTNKNNSAPIGTGPYVFKEWQHGSYALWERNNNYWNSPLPHIDRFVVKFIPDASARTVALETGGVDFGYRTPVPYPDVATLSKMPKINIDTRGYEYSPPNLQNIDFNLEDPILKDLRVRQAIAHAVNRELIAKIVYFGNAVPCASPVVPELASFYNPMPTPYPYDIAAAEKLLDEAGYPAKSGASRLTLTVDYFGNDLGLLCEFLRAELSRIGISLVLRGQDAGSFNKRVFGDGAFQLAATNISNLFDPSLGVARFFWSKNIIKGVPFSNGSHFRNAEVDQLIEDSAIEVDPKKRVAMWMRIQAIVIEQLPALPLVMLSWKTISQKRVQDLTVNAEGCEGSLAHVWLNT